MTNSDIIFISEEHEKFYIKQLNRLPSAGEYHKALFYCLGISETTRQHINDLYDFTIGCVKPECITAPWQTSSTTKVVRLAFNLYCDGTPTVSVFDDKEEQLSECSRYTPDEIFACSYAPYFLQAVKLRHPAYVEL